MSKDISPSVETLRLLAGSGRRQAVLASALAATLAVGACDNTKQPVGTIGHVKGFAGMVAADEPRAAIIGRDVLSAGGTAADAATAIYFTLAVTYPSAASLGGGGSCIVHDNGKMKTEVIDFPANGSTSAGTMPTAVPAAPRGIFALHAKYGRLRYESLLAEPERLARSGTTVSRALANDLARAVAVLGRDPVARTIFLRPDGTVLREGDLMSQPQLAATIANLRRNTGDFYLGNAARDLVRAVNAAGGTLTLEDLRDQRPEWRDTITFKLGNEVAHFAPPPSVGSTVAGEMIAALWGRWSDTPAAERSHLLAETSARLFADRARWMLPNGWTNDQPAQLLAEGRLKGLLADYNPGRHIPATGLTAPPADASSGTGFAVLDSSGMAVACGVTTYGMFGSGRVAGTTGIVLAGTPGPNGPPAITTMVTVNHNSKEIHFVGAASGGGTAPTALAASFLATAVDNKTLAEALALPRLAHPGFPDAVFVETAPFALDPAPLQDRSHKVTAVAMPSRVEAIECREGHRSPDTCEAATDPRGFGLSTTVGKR